MNHRKFFIILMSFLFLIGLSWLYLNTVEGQKEVLPAVDEEQSHWFLLHRKSNVEYLYLGKPGDKEKSKLIKNFTVKTGRPGERPTPLPQLSGHDYWLITKKSTTDNPETAPYFLTLNVPGIEEYPFGPKPYLECDGQCDWVLPGEFGLHGINKDNTRLSKENPGSSGCIRHSDEDITYLFNLLNPEKEEIRYYIQDI